MAQETAVESARAMWRAYLTGELIDARGMLGMTRSVMRRLPRDPRCRVCLAPFAGFGQLCVRALGFGPGSVSGMNPSLCDRCERLARKYEVGAEVELTLLFADVRGSTTLAEEVGASAFREVIDRFYRVSTQVLVDHNALIENLIGDEVAAIFVPGIAGPDHAAVAVEAAERLLAAMGYGRSEDPWLSVGASVHTGTAYVGAVGSSEAMSVITVLGDAANTTARLASAAGSGEILVSDSTARLAGLSATGREERTLSLKGRNEPVRVQVHRTTQLPVG